MRTKKKEEFNLFRMHIFAYRDIQESIFTLKEEQEYSYAGG